MKRLHKPGSLLAIVFCTLLPYAHAWAEQGDWIVRLRGLAIVPNDSSGAIFLDGVRQSGTGVDVDTQFVPEIDITYMFHRNWGVELIAGAANHNVGLEGNLLGPGSSGTRLFDTWVLPPTVTLQYHFLPDNNIRPYVGFGVNYTTFFSEKSSNALRQAVGGPVNVNVQDSWGWAAQIGMDIQIRDNWFFNVDLKYIDIATTAKLDVKGGALAGSRLKVDVDIDPWIVGAGIGYRF
jgi:outer membrane protein